MTAKINKEIDLRLKAPMIALEKIAQGRHLPKVFAEAALDELKKVQKLANSFGKQKKG